MTLSITFQQNQLHIVLFPLLAMEDLERVIDHTDDPTFFHHLKDIVWFLKIVSPLKGADNTGRFCETYATAFALNKDGLVMTSAHMIPKGAKIQARKVGDHEFGFEAKTAYEKPRFDILLLNIQGAKDCPYGRLAEDGSLSIRQNVYHIGNPFEFVWSFLKGEVVYPCTNNITLPTNNWRCHTYESTALSSNPTYRMMGHIWNKSSFNPKPNTKQLSFEKNLHPLNPIIQIYGLVAGEGTSGGPVFNGKGEIVGMVSSSCAGYECAIHVSMLKEVMRAYKQYLELEGSEDPKTTYTAEGSSSKRQKGSSLMEE